MPYATGLQIRPDFAYCDDCTLNSRPMVHPAKTHPVRIVFVGEAPTDDDLKKGKYFSGFTQKLFERILDELKLTPDEVHKTAAVLCKNRAGKAPSAAEINCCIDRLYHEVKACQPKLIVAMGDKAAKAFLPKSKAISQIRGYLFEQTNIGIPVVPVYHLNHVMRNVGAYPEMIAEIRNAYNKVNFTQVTVNPKIVLVESYSQVDGAISRCWASRDMLAVDVETKQNGELICVGIGNAEFVVIFNEQVLKIPAVKKDISKLLMGRAWVAHNAKFDATALLKNGIPNLIYEDTMLMKHTCDPRRGTNGLKTIAKNLFNAADYDADLKEYKNAMELVPLPSLYKYNSLDVAYTALIYEYFKEHAAKTPYNTIIQPSINAVVAMERLGITLDLQRLDQVSNELDSVKADLEMNIYALAGEKFNINSTQQLACVLFQKLGVPALDGTSTREEVLEPLAQDFPIVSSVLEYRKIQKLISTYVQGLHKAVGTDNRVRTTFNLHGTETGRLSSSNPINLQNIPRPDTDGGRIRNLFTASEGYTLIEADYSQLELRVLAHETQDENLLEAYHTGIDIHTLTGSKIFKKPMEEVTKTERYVAKTLNFSIVYGAKAERISATAGISLDEAKKAIKEWFKAYPKVTEWIAAVQKHVLEHQEVTTSLGWQRKWAIVSYHNRDEVMREAVNTMIQSTAGLITLKALTDLSKHIDGDNTRILLTVHDSILLETRDNVDKISALVRKVMCATPKTLGLGTVPYDVDIKYGERWGSL